MLSIFSMKQIPMSSDQSREWRRKLGVGSGRRKREEQVKGDQQFIIKPEDRDAH